MRAAAGYAPIGGYGVIGDGRSVALVAVDGRVERWAMPRLDATPMPSAPLDPRGGVLGAVSALRRARG